MGFVAELGGEFSTVVASIGMTSDRDALIVALYEEGVPVAEIAEVAGVCMKTGVGGAGPAQRQPDLYAAQGERFWRK